MDRTCCVTRILGSLSELCPAGETALHPERHTDIEIDNIFSGRYTQNSNSEWFSIPFLNKMPIL